VLGICMALLAGLMLFGAWDDAVREPHQIEKINIDKNNQRDK